MGILVRVVAFLGTLVVLCGITAAAILLGDATSDDVVLLILGAGLGAILSLAFAFSGDSWLRRRRERAALTGFVEKLREVESEMAFYRTYVANDLRAYAAAGIAISDEARRAFDSLADIDISQYRLTLQSLFDYVEYHPIETKKKGEIIKWLRIFEEDTKPWFASGHQQRPKGTPGRFSALLNVLAKRLDFLPYERTRNFDATPKPILICGRIFRFYSNEPITFHLYPSWGCHVEVNQVVYSPVEGKLYWYDVSDTGRRLVDKTDYEHPWAE